MAALNTLGHAPSDKQLAIFDWFSRITLGVIKHLVVRARAGTGKTSTICAALAYIPPGITTLVCAFGKDIQLELVKKVAQSRNITITPSGNKEKDERALASAVVATTGVDVRTIHSLGLQCVKRFWTDVKVNYGSERQDDLAQRVCGAAAPDAIKKLVATLCTKGRLTTPHAAKADDLVSVAIEFECNPDEQWERDGFGLDYVCAKALDAMLLAASEKPTRTGIDGADMIYLPVRNGWLRKAFDVVIVDEGQDMNACQLEIAQGLCRNNMIVVGDDRQAIYGFAGADSGSLDRLKTALDADELPLNVTYRCGRAIVELAQRYVADFEAGPHNADGVIESLSYECLTQAAGPSDFILSRVNAPLVSVAMKLLRSGKRTKIAGRDIGQGLISLVRKLRGRSVPDFLGKVAAWEAREIARLQPALAKATNGRKKTIEQKIDGIADKAMMLASLADGAPSVSEIETRITSLFTDDGEGDKGLIVCSSVHKAKGKEANRVFVLKETLRNGGEEDNIAYVAITRAKQTLVWVSEKGGVQ